MVGYAHVLGGCGGVWVNLDGCLRNSGRHASVHARVVLARLVGVSAALWSGHRWVSADYSRVACL